MTPGPDIVTPNAAREGARPELSVLVPVFRYDASALVEALAGCSGAAACELVLYDDGSGDAALASRLRSAVLASPMPAVCVEAGRNLGRSGARNQLIAHARADWLLLLDCDMLPDGLGFLDRYRQAAAGLGGPGLVVGGFSLDQSSDSPRYALHRWQSLASECVPASVRAMEPGRYVFTSNVLSHRQVLADAPFDERFSGWGWEDVDWGLRVAERFPVVHIDNTASHLGLDTPAQLMAKYARSGGNFRLLVERHPAAAQSMSLFKAARFASKLPAPMRNGARILLEILLRGESSPLPVSLRGRLLKVWRALVYGGAW